MPAKVLTDSSIKALKPREKDYAITVGGCPGLLLAVSARTGNKVFRLQYRFEGKPRLLTLGPYPGMSLFEARSLGLQHKEDIRRGIDPCAEKRSAKAKNKTHGLTFRALTKQWLEKVEPGWSETHRKDTEQKLEAYIFPCIGDMPVASIGKSEIKAILDSLDARGKIPTIKKVRSIISRIFQYGALQDIPGIEHDPTVFLRAKGLFSAHKPKNMAALTIPKEVAGYSL